MNQEELTKHLDNLTKPRETKKRKSITGPDGVNLDQSHLTAASSKNKSQAM
jgi:hypothetical protein